MKKHLILAVAMAAGALVVTGCQSLSMPSAPGKQARAALEARSGSNVAGNVQFTERGDKVLLTTKVTGLKPGSEHGFHIHEKGDCSAPDATSAGGHFNPDGHAHGHPGQGTHHAGDLNNLVADGKGEANVSFEVPTLRVDNGKYGILDRAVVIHASPDDYKSQPAGNSGGRIACGVIRKN